MIRLFIYISLSLNLFASDINITTQTPLNLSVFDINMSNIDNNETNVSEQLSGLSEDSLFKAKREDGFTIYDAIDRAMLINPKIAASHQVVIQKQQNLVKSEAGHLPVIKISGDIARERRTNKADDTNPESNSQVPLVQVYNYKKTDLFFTLTENLWSGGSIEQNIDQEQANLRASIHDYRDKLESLILEVITAYFNVVYSEIALNISEKNMKNYEKILKIVTIKERNGAATKGDVNYIIANVDNAKTELIQTQSALSDAMANYVYLLDTDNKEDLPFQTVSPLYLVDLNTSLKNADKYNAKMLTQREYINAARLAYHASDGNFHPKVDFSINAESKNEFDIGIGEREKVNAMITFSYNLYNGHKDEANSIKLLAKMKERNYLYQDMKRKLDFDIKVIHRSIRSLDQSLALTQSEVIAARKVVKSYWVAFEHGTQDLQALQLAQRNLNRAEQDYAKYKKNLLINNFQFMKQTGVLIKYLELPYKEHTKHVTIY